MMAAAVAVATVPGDGWGEADSCQQQGQRGLGSAVTVVVLDAAGAGAGADEGDGEAQSGGDGTRGADSSSSGVGAGSPGGPDDSGTHRGPRPRPRLLAVPVTPAELAARSVGLDGVVLRGWHIRALRRYAGLSVPELAHRLSYSRSQVWSWECERCQCPAAVYPALIAACEVARQEREALLRRARLHLIVIDEEGAEEGDS